MAILTARMAGPELARDDVAAAGKASQRLFNLPHRKSPARRVVAAEEGDVRPRPADQEGRQRLLPPLQERIRQTDPDWRIQPVSVQPPAPQPDPPVLVSVLQHGSRPV